MFKIDSTTKQINITRGDIGIISLTAKNEDGTDHTFETGDVIRIGVFPAKDFNTVIIQKDFTLLSDETSVDIYLEKQDTTIGDLINKPVDYWYEIQLNPDTEPQTIIGYDEEGPKIFRLYPEGVKLE